MTQDTDKAEALAASLLVTRPTARAMTDAAAMIRTLAARVRELERPGPIPVEREMPPPNSEFLVWFAGDRIGIANTFSKWKHPSNPLGYFIQGHSGSHNDVTHWMPIPAKPSQQKDQTP